MSSQQIELSPGSYAFVMAQVALLNCEVSGMLAENQHCLNCGLSVPYGDDAFTGVQKKYEAMIGCNAILSMVTQQ